MYSVSMSNFTGHEATGTTVRQGAGELDVWAVPGI
jgi:hypothetical protein